MLDAATDAAPVAVLLDAGGVFLLPEPARIAGAFTRAEFEQALSDAGFVDVEIRETHRVHEQAGSAIIRARRPRSG
jgi:hypothetical protein